MTGGRRDLTYSVVCEHCDGAFCVSCGEKVRFEPGAADLRDSTVIATDLDSHLNYTFTVETHSGVSQFGTKRPTVSITTALDYTGESQHMISDGLQYLIVWRRTMCLFSYDFVEKYLSLN